jgi:hypothetical protein
MLVTGVEAHTASSKAKMVASTLRRQAPEVGAVCLNWARTVMCGGRSAMSVPTAISVLE